MNYFYSPATGEHINTDDPAPWMGRAGKPVPDYDPAVSSCFWRDGDWVIVSQTPNNDLRIGEISARLAQIDVESVRPLRAIAAGAATDYDREKIARLDDEAAKLRAELATL